MADDTKRKNEIKQGFMDWADPIIRGHEVTFVWAVAESLGIYFKDGTDQEKQLLIELIVNFLQDGMEKGERLDGSARSN